MPYNPGIEYRGDRYIAQAGQNISADIQEALRKFEEQKRKTAFADSMFGYLKDVPGAVTPELLGKYHEMSGTQKYETVMGAASNAAMIAAKRQQTDDANYKERALAQQLQIASMRDTEDPDLLKPRPIGPEAPGKFWSPKTGAVFDANDTKNADDWGKLDADSKHISGVGVGDWTRATNHRVENGMFIADLPAKNPPPAGLTPQMMAKLDPATVASFDKGRTLKMPVNEYDLLRRRYNQLSTGDRSTALAPAAAAAAPGPAPDRTPYAPGMAPSPGGGAPTATTAPTTTGKVKVKRSDGLVGTIPAEQLPAALAQGYTRIQ